MVALRDRRNPYILQTQPCVPRKAGQATPTLLLYPRKLLGHKNLRDIRNQLQSTHWFCKVRFRDQQDTKSFKFFQHAPE